MGRKVNVKYNGDVHIGELKIEPLDVRELEQCYDCGGIATNRLSITVICCGVDAWYKCLCDVCTEQAKQEALITENSGNERLEDKG